GLGCLRCHGLGRVIRLRVRRNDLRLRRSLVLGICYSHLRKQHSRYHRQSRFHAMPPFFPFKECRRPPIGSTRCAIVTTRLPDGWTRSVSTSAMAPPAAPIEHRNRVRYLLS